MNQQKSLWMSKPGGHKEGYATFYKHTSNDWEDHPDVKHFPVKGKLKFRQS